MARMGMILRDGIGPVLGYLALNTADNVMDAMESGALEVEAAAQANAPWTDDTGNARDGLTASVYMEGGEVVLELAHTVDYGYWLEVIQDGNFAIIMPTLETMGEDIINRAGGRVTDTGGGF